MYHIVTTDSDRRERLDKLNKKLNGAFYFSWGVPVISGTYRQNCHALKHEAEDRDNKVAFAEMVTQLSRLFKVDLDGLGRRPDDFMLPTDADAALKVYETFLTAKTIGEKATIAMGLWHYILGQRRMQGRVPFVEID